MFGYRWFPWACGFLIVAMLALSAWTIYVIRTQPPAWEIQMREHIEEWHENITNWHPHSHPHTHDE